LIAIKQVALGFASMECVVALHLENVRSGCIEEDDGTKIELKFDPPVSVYEARRRLREYKDNRAAFRASS
jgi:hypothetical protein